MSGLLGKGLLEGGCAGAVKKIALQFHVLSGALYPSCMDVAGAGFAVPAGGGNMGEAGAAKVEGGVAPVTHECVRCVWGKVLVACSAWGGFQ